MAPDVRFSESTTSFSSRRSYSVATGTWLGARIGGEFNGSFDPKRHDRLLGKVSTWLFLSILIGT